MLILDLQFFGGRGASSASSSGGSSGLSSGATITSQNNNVTSNSEAQADDTQQAQAMGASYDAFMKMSDDEKADYIEQAIAKPVPVFLADVAFQRFTFNSNMNDKPQLVDDATLDKMNGTELFRTVNEAKDKRNRIVWGADDIAKQVMGGSVTRCSDAGGSVHGRGIYFANTYSGSVSGYGNSRGDIKKTAVMRAKLNSNARIIDSYTASTNATKEIRSHSKLGKALAKMDTASATSMWALSKGYNVITNGYDYINVLNRNAITMSKTIKPASSRWK